MSNLLVLVLAVVSMMPGNQGWKGRTDASASAFGLTTPRPLRGSTLVSWKSLTPNDHCTKEDGREGRCVQSYLCVDDRINNDGSDLTDERTLECEAPAVCCPLNEKVTATTTGKPSTLVPGVVTKPTGPGQVCEAFDGSSGRCLYPHLCTNDSTVIDGSDILDERTTDPCPNWQGAIQICCPESYWKGKIDGGVNNMTTPVPTPDGKDETCKTATREEGLCVPFYQCERDDGADVINVRYTTVRECGFTKTCCPKSSVDISIPPPTPPPSNKCGMANPNGIVYRNITGNTNEARYGEFPWMVAVRTRTGPGDSFNTTGGSIVHPWIVLTAAHYVARAVDEDVRVRGGEWDTLAKDEPLPYQERNVRKIVLHPEFNNRNKHNDIALLFLTTAFTPAPHVGVVCLPPQGYRAQPSTDCVANGWGKDKFGKEGHLQNILKKTVLPVMSPAECQSRLRNTRLGPFYELHAGFMCAGGERLDTCTQDGGGPLACPTLNDPNRYVQHGIVSWGIGCGQDGVPGVYVDVGQYRSWIDQEVAKEGYKLHGTAEEL